MARWLWLCVALAGCDAERPPGVLRDGLMGTLTVTVTENGNPVPARVIAKVPNMIWKPSGVELRWSKRGEYFYTTGRFTLSVPADRMVSFEVTRGLEYDVARGQATVGAGHSASITIPLTRWITERNDGWYSGDMHIHMNYGAPRSYSMTPAAAGEILKSEDLNVGNFLAANGNDNAIASEWTRIFDAELLDGQPVSVDASTLYCVGEEFRTTPFFGHAILLGISGPIRPFYGEPSPSPTPTPAPYVSVFDQATEARRQGGLVSFAHPVYAGQDGPWELPLLAANRLLDSIDILHFTSDEGLSAGFWYWLLNTGSEIAATAGTDMEMSASDGRSFPPGCNRVYVKVDSFDYRGWLDGIRRRRTFVTDGPMLSLEVNGAGIGERINLPSPSPSPVRVVATARSSRDRPFRNLDILINGEPFHRVTSPSPTPSLTFDQMVPITESSWIVARVADSVEGADVCDTLVYAHTSPVWVLLNNQPVRVRRSAEELMSFLGRAMLSIEALSFTVAGKQQLLDRYQAAYNHYSALR